jgi:hypothetical protein
MKCVYTFSGIFEFSPVVRLSVAHMLNWVCIASTEGQKLAQKLA